MNITILVNKAMLSSFDGMFPILWPVKIITQKFPKNSENFCLFSWHSKLHFTCLQLSNKGEVAAALI